MHKQVLNWYHCLFRKHVGWFKLFFWEGFFYPPVFNPLSDYVQSRPKKDIRELTAATADENVTKQKV